MRWGPSHTLGVLVVATVAAIVVFSRAPPDGIVPTATGPPAAVPTAQLQSFSLGPAAPPAPGTAVPAGNAAVATLPAPAAPVTAPGATLAPAPAVETAPAVVPVDETALRYFARQGDTLRLQAEIARLSALHPDWIPPADPLAAPVYTDAELDWMWALFSEGRFAEVRTAIADRQQRQPGWVAPAALLDLLAVGEARNRIVAASNARQYATVVDTAAATPSLLVCGEMDVLWRVAEAFAKTGRADRALDAYAYILATCDDPTERVATMQKAFANLAFDDFATLWTYERTQPDGMPEFAGIRIDVSRAALAEAGEDAAFDLSPEDRMRMEEAARTGTGASDALLLGWYYQLRDDYRRAEPWFRLAHQREETAESAQGLALALTALGRNAEAEDIAYGWRDATEDNLAVYLAAIANLLGELPRPTLQPSILNRIIAVIADARDPIGARQIGWYAYDLDQVGTAEMWFETALRFAPDDEEAAYGLAVARQRLLDTAGFNEVVRLWSGRSERIRLLGLGITVAPGATASAILPTTTGLPTAGSSKGSSSTGLVGTFSPGSTIVDAVPTRPTTYAPPAVTVAPVASTPATTGTSSTTCTRTIDPATLTPAAALSRAWCLMEMERAAEAAEAFAVALRSSSAATRSDAAYGQALAYLRQELTDLAAIAATQAELPAARATEIHANILSQRATSAYAAGRYAEALVLLDERARIAGERNDLLMIRGYSYMHLGEYRRAHDIFSTVANAGFPDARDGLAQVESRMIAE